MTYDSTILADTPKAYYKLDESSGTACSDSSGNAFGLTYQTGVSLSQTGVCNDGGTAVKGSGSAAIALETASFLPGLTNNPAAETIEAWVNIATTSESGCVGMIGASSGGIAMGIGATSFVTAGNNLILYSMGKGYYNTSIAIGTGVHYITLTWDNTSHFTGWIDGSQVFTIVGSTNFHGTGVAIGGSTYSSFYCTTGIVVDNTAFYGAKLTSTRIAAHYTAGAGGGGGGGGTPRGAFRLNDPLRRQAIIRASSY